MKPFTFIAGLGALIGGIVLHGHYEATKQLCESGLGTVSQAFSSTVAHQCTKSTGLADLGLALAVMGGLALLGLVAGTKRRKTPAARPTTSGPAAGQR